MGQGAWGRAPPDEGATMRSIQRVTAKRFLRALSAVIPFTLLAAMLLLVPACEREPDIDFDEVFRDAVAVEYLATDVERNAAARVRVHGNEAVQRLRSALQSADREFIEALPESLPTEFITVHRDGLDDIELEGVPYEEAWLYYRGTGYFFITGDELNEVHAWLKSMAEPVEIGDE